MLLDAKIKNSEDKTPAITNLATNTTLNPEIKEIEHVITSIANLSTIAAYITVETKIPNVIDLVKKTDDKAKMSEMENKHFTTSYYNNFTSTIPNAKITRKKLINEYYLNQKITIQQEKKK